MNAERLRSLADAGATRDLDALARLTEVHARIEAARRRRLVGVACGLLVAVVVGAGFVGRSLAVDRAGGPADTSRPSPAPVERRDPLVGVGYPGLPPADAVASDPHVPQLMLRTFRIGPDYRTLRLWLFDDGRLITDEQYVDGGHVVSATGYVERRLTSRGVEALRGYVARTGGPGEGCCPLSAELQVRKGTRLVPLGPQTVDYLRLAEPETWLPPGSWADETPVPYVAASWAVCFQGDRLGAEIPKEELVANLPQPVADLLLARLRVEDWPGLEPGPGCSVVTLAEAHTVVAALEDAVAAEDPPMELYVNVVLETLVSAESALEPGDDAFFGVFPVMPDGTWRCTDCA